MTSSEIGAIVVGLIVGYLMISAFLPKKKLRDRPVGSEGNDSAAAKAADAPRPAAWNEILGLASGATSDEIRQAYRNLIGKYHPDKVASLGEEIRVVAERRTREITTAYREGMRQRSTKS